MPTIIGKPSRGKANFSNYRPLLGKIVTLHWKRQVSEQVDFIVREHDGQIGFTHIKTDGLDDRIFLNMSQAMKPFSRPSCHSGSSNGIWFLVRTGPHAGKTLADF